MDANVFPGWEIVEKLGAGAFSTVYKIRKTDGLGGEYFSALKVISIPNSEDEYRRYREDGYDDQTITKMFESQVKAVTSEFKLLSDFRGTANIVSFEDYKVQQKQDGIGWEVFIKMELLSTLPAVFMQKPLTVEQTVKLGTDICSALILCEQKKIIHRDIKPQNIFVNDFGDYKLGDFGIARNMDHTTRATKIGTPAYMAPEVFHGNAYNNTADIYSLGMVMYWALNERRLPFVPMPPAVPTADDVTNAQQQRLAGVPLPPPKNGTEALKQAVLKACAFDPKQRFATAKELKAALAASLAAPVVHTVPTAPIAQDIEATVAVRKAPKAQKQSNNKQQIDSQQQSSNKQKATQQATSNKRQGNGQQNSSQQQSSNKQQSKKQPKAVPLWSAQQAQHPQRPPEEKKSKKWLIILLCLLLVIGLGVGAYFMFFSGDTAVKQSVKQSVSSQVATDSKSNDNITCTLKDGTLTISGEGPLEDPRFTATRDEIKKVVINSGVTSIGEDAFSNYGSLTSITIPDSVTSIGEYAFFNCNSLTSVIIGNGVTSIEEHAFFDCDSLTSVTIPNSVTSIGDSAFYHCDSLTSVIIGNGVTSIEEAAFYCCDSLTAVHISDMAAWCGIEFGGDDYRTNPLSYAKNLYLNGSLVTNLVIPDSVTSIGNYAFSGCDSLTSITFPDSVTSIGVEAFSECRSLTSVTIPNSVTSIGEEAFHYCDALTSVIIGGSVTSIGKDAFSYCTDLTSVTIPDSVTSIGEEAFSVCYDLTSVNYKGTKAQWAKVSLGSSWKRSAPFTVVHCTDGDVAVY